MNSIIWCIGCGKLGEEFLLLNEKQMRNLRFVDNNTEKQGKPFGGAKGGVLSYNDFLSQVDRTKDEIVITTAKVDEIYIQLKKDGLERLLRGVYKSANGRKALWNLADSYNRKCTSQLGEDIGLQHFFESYYRPDYKGIYVDVGAFHPFVYSNTSWMYEKGWHGINIDPSTESIRLFDVFRPDDKNICCAVGVEEGETDFYTYNGSARNTICNDGDMEKYESVKEVRKVPVRKLETILKECGITKIDVLDVDAEGMDEKIIMDFDFSKYTPTCVLVELLDKGIEGHLKSPLHKKMINSGYILIAFYMITAFYANINQRDKDINNDRY